MKPALIPGSEDFLYWDPETIGNYPRAPGDHGVAASELAMQTEQPTLWLTLSRQWLASLALGFGAGMFAAAALSLAVLLLSAG